MWMTGFDVPNCSTIYLDKPMKNHTLMQTIARANCVFAEKVNGLIVDYIGIFRDLQKALAIYGSGLEGGLEPGEMPVEAKQALVENLRQSIQETREFLGEYNVDLDTIREKEGFERVRVLDDAVDALVSGDETNRQYLIMADKVDSLFHAILPDLSVNEFGPDRKAIVILAEKVRSLSEPANISAIMDKVDVLLDQSIAPKGYVIADNGQDAVDLS